MTNKIHEGRNIKRFREMLGVKQEALAFELDDWSQKKISLPESKEKRLTLPCCSKYLPH